MPGNFTSPDGDLETVFVTDYGMIDQYAKTGSLWTWGIGSAGQLGDNTTTAKSSPVQTVAAGTNWKQVCVGQSHIAAVKMDGTLWLWGANEYGQMGNNVNTTYYSSPIQTIAGGTNWKQVAVGQRFTVAIKTDGTMWSFGTGSSGQLGDNTSVQKSSPVQIVGSSTDWRQVVCGQTHALAIKTNGTLWAWGGNASGQLGDNTRTARSSPVQTIATGTNWRTVATSGQHTVSSAAIKTDGTLWVWGSNAIGQLGTNDLISYSSPVQTVAGGTNWRTISAGSDHFAGIKTDGTLWLWGRNASGQLGNSTVTHSSSPIQTIAGGTNWKAVATGGTTNGHTLAIKADGTLWTWGYNTANGPLGTGNLVSRSSPGQTVAGGTNWKQVTAFASSSAAIYFYDANSLYPSA